MEAGLKQKTSTGSLPSIREASDNIESLPNNTSLMSLALTEQPQSSTAPILEGSATTGKSKTGSLLALTIAIQDFSEVMRRLPKSWIASKDGKIYMCIDSTDTGKLSLVDGNPCFDDIPVSVLLERILEATTGKIGKK